MRGYRSFREGLTADVGRAIAMATGGAALLIPVEYVLALWTYAGPIDLGNKLALVPLVITLCLFLWLWLVIGLGACAVVVRLVRVRFDPARATGPSLFDLAPAEGGIRPGVPRVWGGLATAAVYAFAMSRVVTWAATSYKEPQLMGLLAAAIGLPIAAIAWLLARPFVQAARVVATAFAWLGVCNPFARWRALAVAFAIVIAVGLVGLYFVVPASRQYLHVRLVVSGIVVAWGAGLGLRSIPRRRAQTRRAARPVAIAALVLTFSTLVHFGADPTTRYIAITASPAMEKLVGVVRVMNDLDRDGYGSVLGGNDCNPWRADIHPGDAVDIPDDGIDQNCDGYDFSLAAAIEPTGPTLPIPAQFDRDWNFLLITIDALRYDRTTMGGYATGPKKRDTTPNLARLAARSTSFLYAQSPSAGTMASVPAILTSKFFHSGIALDEKRPAGTPPGILPENVLITEIVRSAGYKTGVIGAHEWWTGWGIDQGVDPEDFDNTLGLPPNPRRIVADKITDHALAWISRHQGKKWFLWAHYIDPHGIYMPHPDVVDWGKSDPDLYDAEIRWTDQELGRLLDELVRLPSYANTIIIVTADHGENMGEHNGTIGTHGNALYREQTHVPFLIFVPGNRPQKLHGAVTNLDIVPTVAALAKADVSELSFEGRSLVPQLFYGKQDLDRIVFAETNAPGKQRAAISERFRLIYYLPTNLLELFDHHDDFEEKVNLAPKNPPELAVMKKALDLWMARVMYARDPLFNQAFRQMSDVVLRSAPTPPVPTVGQSIDGKLEILGIGPADGKPWAPGAKTDLHVYFHATAPATAPYRFSLAVWPAAPGTPLTAPTPPGLVRGPARATADGAYPADKWKAGDYIRERFPFNVPPTWQEGGVGVGLIVIDPATNQRIPAAGPAPTNDPTIHVLGVIPLHR